MTELGLPAETPVAAEHPSYNTLLQQNSQLLAIAEVTRAIVSELDLDRLLQLAADLLHQRFNYPFVHIFIAHPGRRWLEFKAGAGAYVAELQIELSVSLDDPHGIIPWVGRTGQAVLTPDVRDVAQFRPFSLPNIDIKSELTVPLIFGGEVLGVFDVESELPHAFSEHDLWLLETLGASIATALRNARLYRSEHWRSQAADVMRDVAGALRARNSLSQMLQAILQGVASILPVHFAAIWKHTPTGYLFKTGYQIDWPLAGKPLQQAWFDAVIAGNRALVRQFGDGHIPGAENFPEGFSAVGAPLIVDDYPLGVLVLVHRDRQRYGLESRRITEIFATQAATIIDNDELYRAAKEETWVSNSLLEAAHTLVAAGTIDQIVAQVTTLIPKLIGAVCCVAFLREPNGELALRAAFSELDVPQIIDPDAFPALAQSLNENRVCEFDAHEPLPTILHTTISGRYRYGMVMPLYAQGEPFGAVVAFFQTDTIASADKQRDILAGIVYQASLALDNARLYQKKRRQDRLEHDLQLAKALQTSFLPDELPDLSDWELASYWQMAEAVGGDFFDIIPMPKQRMMFIIADVADKGMPAALLMAKTSSLVRSASLELVQPTDILERVNALLSEKTSQGMFVTAFCAILNRESGELRFASAGHNPPLLVRADGQVSPLPAKGIVLGVLPNATYKQAVIHLQAGDGLLFYTDGVTEAFNPHGEQFGQNRLMETLRQAWAQPAKAIVTAIRQTVNEFTHPHPQSDDATLLLVRRKVQTTRETDHSHQKGVQRG